MDPQSTESIDSKPSSDQRKIIIFLVLGFFAGLLVALLAFVLFMLANQNNKMDIVDDQKDEVATEEETDSKEDDEDKIEDEEGVLEPTSTAQPSVAKLKLFVLKSPESSDDFDAVFTVQRTTTRADVATFIIEQYITGLTPEEQAQGYYIPGANLNLLGSSNCGGKDFTIKVSSGVGTLKFCKQMMGIGGIMDQQLVQILKKSLEQFSTINKAVILDSNDNCLFDMSDLNLCKD